MMSSQCTFSALFTVFLWKLQRHYLFKDIALHQVLQLLCDLVLKANHILTLAHAFIKWFVCRE